MFSLLGDLAFACPHGLGHGVSTKIHDKPSLKRKSKTRGERMAPQMMNMQTTF